MLILIEKKCIVQKIYSFGPHSLGRTLSGLVHPAKDLSCIGFGPRGSRFVNINKTEHHKSYTLHLVMDAQPDIGKLAEAFTTSSASLAVVSHEIALVANLPALNDGRLLEAIERLNTSINNLTTTVNTLRADVTTLRADVTTLRADMNINFDSLELSRRAESAYFTPFQRSL